MTEHKKDLRLWGHSLTDYVEMFALTEDDLNANILDCYGGPSSFNVELTEKGGHVVSNDPLFSLSLNLLKDEIDKKFANMLKRVEASKERFIWKGVESPTELAKERQRHIEHFLQDFPKGSKEGRYRTDELPDLSFDYMQFDLALCSHFLFVNSADQSAEFHVAAIEAMCNVAHEVRIFPLLDSMGEIPKLVEPVMLALHQRNFGLEFKAVPYEFQKKGNAMLRVWAQTCELNS